MFNEIKNNNIINEIAFENIRRIYKEAIFGQRCDHEEIITISIEMAQLIEFQGQGIMLDWENVFMDRNNHVEWRELVKDTKNSYPFSPFRHIILK